MKQYLRVASLFATVLFFASCASTGGASSAALEDSTATAASSAGAAATGATTRIAAIDTYGNATLAMSYDEFSALGFAPGDTASVSVAGFAFDALVCANCGDADAGGHVIRVDEGSGAVTLAISMGDFARTSGADVGSVVTITSAQTAR